MIVGFFCVVDDIKIFLIEKSRVIKNVKVRDLISCICLFVVCFICGKIFCIDKYISRVWFDLVNSRIWVKKDNLIFVDISYVILLWIFWKLCLWWWKLLLYGDESFKVIFFG